MLIFLELSGKGFARRCDGFMYFGRDCLGDIPQGLSHSLLWGEPSLLQRLTSFWSWLSRYQEWIMLRSRGPGLEEWCWPSARYLSMIHRNWALGMEWGPGGDSSWNGGPWNCSQGGWSKGNLMMLWSHMVRSGVVSGMVRSRMVAGMVFTVMLTMMISMMVTMMSMVTGAIWRCNSCSTEQNNNHQHHDCPEM